MKMYIPSYGHNSKQQNLFVFIIGFGAFTVEMQVQIVAKLWFKYIIGVYLKAIKSLLMSDVSRKISNYGERGGHQIHCAPSQS